MGREYDQDKLAHTLEILKQRKADINETYRNHACGSCMCPKDRPWQCRNTQKILNRKVRAHRESIKDLEGWVK